MPTHLAIVTPIKRVSARRIHPRTMQPTGDAVVFVRMPREMSDALTARAARRKRSVADYVRNLIARALAK